MAMTTIPYSTVIAVQQQPLWPLNGRHIGLAIATRLLRIRLCAFDETNKYIYRPWLWRNSRKLCTQTQTHRRYTASASSNIQLLADRFHARSPNTAATAATSTPHHTNNTSKPCSNYNFKFIICWIVCWPFLFVSKPKRKEMKTNELAIFFIENQPRFVRQCAQMCGVFLWKNARFNLLNALVIPQMHPTHVISVRRVMHCDLAVSIEMVDARRTGLINFSELEFLNHEFWPQSRISRRTTETGVSIRDWETQGEEQLA